MNEFLFENDIDSFVNIFLYFIEYIFFYDDIEDFFNNNYLSYYYKNIHFIVIMRINKRYIQYRINNKSFIYFVRELIYPKYKDFFSEDFNIFQYICNDNLYFINDLFEYNYLFEIIDEEIQEEINEEIQNKYNYTKMEEND